MHPEASRLIDVLALAAHPEGGFFRETFRAPLLLEGLPHGAPRAASTAIYFLLPSGVFSALHRVRSDEVWHHYAGDPLRLETFDEAGARSTIRLGPDVLAGERPQHVVFANHYQAAIPIGDRYSLVGCTVAPGFDFADFEMPSREALTARFPSLRDLIEQVTR